MTGQILHVFTNPVPDGTVTSIVRPSDWNSAHTFILQDGVQIAGNTAGVLADISAGTFVLAGGNNVTLSQDGNSVTVSGPHTSQFLTTAALSNHSHGNPQLNLTNLSGTTASNSAGLTLSLSAGNLANFLTTAALSNHSHGNPQLNLTNLSGTTASASNGFTLSLSAGDLGAFLTTAALSNHSHGNPQLNLTNISGTTASASNGFTLSLSAGAIPTVTNSSWTISDNGTSGTVGRLAFTNLNGVTLSLSSGTGGLHTIVGSHNALTSQSNQNVTAANGGFAFQTLSFSNAQGVSFVTSAGSAVVASVETSYAASNHSHGNPTLALTNLSGTTASNSAGLTLSLSAGAGGAGDGGNIIAAGTRTAHSLSTVLFSNANGLTFGLDAVAGSVITGSYTVPTLTNSSMSVSDAATSGTLARLAFTNLNGVTLSLSTGAGGSHTIVGSHNALTTARASTDAVGLGTAQTNVTWTVNSLGISLNAAGYAGTGTSATNISLTHNSNGLAASVAGPFTRSRFNPFMEAVGVAGQVGQNTLHFHPIPDPEAFQYDRIIFDVSGTQATQTNSSGSFTLSVWAGIYSRNASTLSLVVSSSTSLGLSVSGTVRSTLNNGARIFSMGWTTTITQNDLWLGLVSRTTSAGNNLFTLSQILASDIAADLSGHLGVANNASVQNVLGLGIYSATTTGIPGSVGFSQITGTASAFLRVPLYYFLSQTV